MWNFLTAINIRTIDSSACNYACIMWHFARIQKIIDAKVKTLWMSWTSYALSYFKQNVNNFKETYWNIKLYLGIFLKAKMFPFHAKQIMFFYIYIFNSVSRRNFFLCFHMINFMKVLICHLHADYLSIWNPECKVTFSQKVLIACNILQEKQGKLQHLPAILSI